MVVYQCFVFLASNTLVNYQKKHHLGQYGRWLIILFEMGRSFYKHSMLEIDSFF